MTNTLSTIPNLFEIVTSTQAIELALWESGGELTPELEKTLAINEQTLTQKVDDLAHLISRLENLASYHKSMSDRFRGSSDGIKAVVARLEDNIQQAMEALEKKHLTGRLHSFSLRKCPVSLKVTDETLIDPEYFKEVVTRSLEKKRVKQDLELGVSIPGCSLIQNTTLKIGLSKLEIEGEGK